MPLLLEIALVAALTVALFFGASRLVRFALRLSGIKAQLAAMMVRLTCTVLLAVGIGLSSAPERKFALVITVGAVYFAAAVLDGIRQMRATPGTPAR